MVRVALVGYTNVGKSTLMNLLAKSNVFAENKLFATVDSTVRKVVWNKIPFLLSDTVGFIRKLPTTLIECFKSTLAEIVEADILLHVVDISHPAHEEQMQVVLQTLAEIKAVDKKIITVYNKVDLLREKIYEEQPSFEAPLFLQEILTQKKDKQSIFISATKQENIAELRQMIYEAVAERYFQIYPHYTEEFLKKFLEYQVDCEVDYEVDCKETESV